MSGEKDEEEEAEEEKEKEEKSYWDTRELDLFNNGSLEVSSIFFLSSSVL